MIRNLRHVTLSVANIDSAINFYSALGANLISRDHESGDFISHLIGIPNCSLFSAKLHLADGSRLELMEIINPPIEKSDENFSTAVLGLHHIAFTVENIADAVDLVKDSGGGLLSKPLRVPREHSAHAVPAIHCYVHDPFGNIIHLAQDSQEM